MIENMAQIAVAARGCLGRWPTATLRRLSVASLQASQLVRAQLDVRRAAFSVSKSVAAAQGQDHASEVGIILHRRRGVPSAAAMCVLWSEAVGQITGTCANHARVASVTCNHREDHCVSAVEDLPPPHRVAPEPNSEFFHKSVP